MSIKREFYKKYVDRRSRLRKLIYFLILLVLFTIVLRDSFFLDLPFYYMLFIFIGWLMSFLLIKTHKVKWDKNNQKIVVERSIYGWLIIVIIIILRIFLFPIILNKFHVFMTSDAIILIVMGWFWGRIHQLTRDIEGKVFLFFKVENMHSDEN